MAVPTGSGSLAASVKDAYESDVAEPDETTDATADDAEGAEDEAGESGASPEGTGDVTEEATSEDASEATEGDSSEGTDEIPDDYFGFDLSPYSPEQKAAIVAQLEKRDDYIGKLLRDEAEPVGEGDKPSPADDTPPAELTDEAIVEALRGLGLDPDDPTDESVIKGVAPLVRKQVEQDQRLSTLMETIELQELDRSWRASLNGLEKEFGNLPAAVTHDRVMEYAAANGIQHPSDAYWRIVGPARSALESAGKAHRELPPEAKAALAAKKKNAASVRPAATDADADAALESKDVKGATKETAIRLLKQMGIG